MELTIQKQKTNILIPIIILTLTILLYFTNIQATSLPFIIPLLILSLGSGFIYYLLFLLIVTLLCFIQHNLLTFTAVLIVSITIFLLNLFKQLKTKQLPIIVSIIIFPILIVYNYNLIQTIFLSLLLLLNSFIYQQIIPIFIHQNKETITCLRLQAIIIISCLLCLALLPLNTTLTMIIIRYIILLSIYYLSIEKVMPIILYLSIIFIFINPILKDEALSLILPMTGFFMFKIRNKTMFISLYLIFHIILPFFITYNYYYYSFTILIPVILFILTPKLKITNNLLTHDYLIKSKQLQLKSRAEAFGKLFQQLTNVFKEEKQVTKVSEYVGYVYEEVCHQCPSKNYCFYSREGMSRLGKLIGKGMQKELDSNDLDYIEKHCLSPNLYLESIIKHQRSFNKMVRLDSAHYHLKRDLFQEFGIMKDVFINFSNSLDDQKDEEMLLDHLKAYQFDVYYLKKIDLEYQNYLLEIGIIDIDRSVLEEELIPILETYLNTSLDIVSIKKQYHYLGYTSILLKHELKYSLQVAKKQYALDCQNCGDSYISFYHDVHHYVALSDGMGQGYLAFKESKLTLDILSQLVKNGISLKDTMNTLNALLKIKNQGDMYTTLDLCDFNLLNSKLKVIKYGAYQSYLIRDNKIEVIQSHSLPMGMASRIKMLAYEMKIKENDLVIMTSDGVGDKFINVLSSCIKQIEKLKVNEIVSLLFEKAFLQKDLDDMTIIVIKVIKRI